MKTDLESSAGRAEPPATSSREITAFLVTTFLVFPGLAVGFVGAYGFVVWISQMILGPPGPPAG
ncbi:periplasmic nitrate reductase, NapE protein (plasmid) [Thalassobaculum sp. OXR-137]|uniref:periplasmic nitrate reductase, NapE protein n=1 Tax=Thalassobaculum sp. OXR-137 TaxID=3100173 RepID=UPI002AC8C9A6|nr:periplasmic nitrate reductase, NapE protein [Thalassobaculum sp. OXR-137]WPZ37201.1 periplasmic nitrate reductase, NapE protein [Thalassobaculum sp. OXR-137]